MAEQLPGAEFLQRRLARATAIPAAERPRDVAAFVESVQLLREACDLLPLTADGKAALSPDSVAARQQVQLAFLKAARARYLCPINPVCDRPHASHLYPYWKAWCELHSHNSPDQDDDAQALGIMLIQSAESWHLDAADAAHLASSTADCLADEDFLQAASRALQQLVAAAGRDQLPLSLEQLHYLCCYDIAQAADRLQLILQAQSTAASLGVAVPAVFAVEAPAPAQLAAVLKAGQTYAAQLLQLEPHNHKSYLAAACTAGWAGQSDHAVRLSLQALQLARQQHNNLALVKICTLPSFGLAVQAGWRLTAFSAAPWRQQRQRRRTQKWNRHWPAAGASCPKAG